VKRSAETEASQALQHPSFVPVSGRFGFLLALFDYRMPLRTGSLVTLGPTRRLSARLRCPCGRVNLSKKPTQALPNTFWCQLFLRWLPGKGLVFDHIASQEQLPLRQADQHCPAVTTAWCVKAR